MNNAFSHIHPLVQIIFLMSVMTFSMFLNQPVLIGISAVSSLIYVVYLGKRKTLKSVLLYVFPISVLIALTNPLFNHRGATLLTYFPDGNALTLESILYGGWSGLTMSSALMWCMVLGKIMTSDRVIYLFGKIAPKLGLLISMILRFIPKFSSRFHQVRLARHCIGRDINQGTVVQRLKNAVQIFSSMIQWSLENAIDTADSLKSRGYGLPHRTAYSDYHFERRDSIFLGLILVFDMVLAVAWGRGAFEFYYYPTMDSPSFEPAMLILYICYFGLCIMPYILDRGEDIKWKVIRSTI